MRNNESDRHVELYNYGGDGSVRDDGVDVWLRVLHALILVLRPYL